MNKNIINFKEIKAKCTANSHRTSDNFFEISIKKTREIFAILPNYTANIRILKV